MASTNSTFSCVHCSRTFSTTVSLGRHFHAGNIRSMSACPRRNINESEVIVGETTSFGGETTNEELQDETQFVNIADETFQFYNDLGDTSEQMYENERNVVPAIENLCQRARRLLHFCCDHRLTAAEIETQFNHEVFASDGCVCAQEIRAQFPTSQKFAAYVEKARRSFVYCQGWKRAVIRTSAGLNRSGVFRSVLSIIEKEVSVAGGFSQILQYAPKFVDGAQVFSNPINSNSMGNYTRANRTGLPILSIDLYADGTTLANNGAQSANLIRMRLVNVRKRSSAWHEIGIFPSMVAIDSFSDAKMAYERAFLQQRFIYLMLKDAFLASKTGFPIEGRLHILRINTLVCDQPQERSFVCMKAAGSFMDCTSCMMPSMAFRHELGIGPEDTPQDVQDISIYDDVYSVQIGQEGGRERNVVNVVSRQLVLAKSTVSPSNSTAGATYTPDEVLLSKRYLQRVSATHIPPALASCHGLGTEPYHLYKMIGFDKLHTVDLGLLRLLPDFAFKRFSVPEYNKGKLSKAALTKIANNRFNDVARSFGIHIRPFRANAKEVHSTMTGALRRAITPFLWVALLALQPDHRPDDDVLLRAALLANEYQIHMRGINQHPNSALRTRQAIEVLQKVGFDAGCSTSEALMLRISTKLHRIMWHTRDHFLLFGCSRRGDTDENESLHKATKACYKATNKRLPEIATQLVAVRSISNARRLTDALHSTGSALASSSSFETDYLAQIPLTDESLITAYTSDSGDEFEGDLSCISGVDALISELADAVECVDNDDILAVALNMKHLLTQAFVWTESSQIRFTPVLEWMPEGAENVPKKKHIAYATANFRCGGARFDAVQYNDHGISRYGFVQTILQARGRPTNYKAVIIRRLREVDAHPHNNNVVNEFGHKRLAYSIRSFSNCDVILDCVSIVNLQRVVPIVRDLHDVAIRYSISHRPCNIPDTKQERELARFFLVNGVQTTAFPNAAY